MCLVGVRAASGRNSKPLSSLGFRGQESEDWKAEELIAEGFRLRGLRPIRLNIDGSFSGLGLEV